MMSFTNYSNNINAFESLENIYHYTISTLKDEK